MTGSTLQIEYYIGLARELGGKIECGGDRPVLPPPFDAGAFVNPTVITVRALCSFNLKQEPDSEITDL